MLQSSFSSLQLDASSYVEYRERWYQRIKLVENAQMPGNAEPIYHSNYERSNAAVVAMANMGGEEFAGRAGA